MSIKQLEELTKHTVRTQKADYLAYKAEFKNFSFFKKLWLILWHTPAHLYRRYFAPDNERSVYRSLTWYLNRDAV